MGSRRFNRRDLLKSGATFAGGLTLGAAAPVLGQEGGTHAPPPMIKGDSDGLIAYGERSNYVKSVRIPHGGRPSPDTFGLTFHVATPLQDSVGVITPSRPPLVRRKPHAPTPGSVAPAYVPVISPAVLIPRATVRPAPG